MMTRMEFLRSLAGVGAGVLGAAALAGCKSDDDASVPDASTTDAPGTPIDAPTQPMDAPAMTCATATGAIGTNHGHAITIPPADLAAGVDQTYAIRGTSAHPHSVVVTAAMFTMLRATGSLTVTSSTDAGHSHVVTLTCG